MNGDPKPQPYGLEVLEHMAEQGCSVPGCEHQHKPGEVFLVQKCHPKTGLEVSYTKGTGVVALKCRTCHLLVAEISVNLLAIRYDGS